MIFIFIFKSPRPLKAGGQEFENICMEQDFNISTNIVFFKQNLVFSEEGGIILSNIWMRPSHKNGQGQQIFDMFEFDWRA